MVGQQQPGALHIAMFDYNGTYRIWASTNGVGINGLASITGDLLVGGNKSRLYNTDDFGKRLLYACETPSPYFGDIGEGETDDNGECRIDIDPIFEQTVQLVNYQVFLTSYGNGELYVKERTPTYFTVREMNGACGVCFGWEIKAKQNDVSQLRLETEPAEIEQSTNYGNLAADYIYQTTEGRIQ